MWDNRVYIIGVGAGGPATLPPEMLQLINGAEVVFGGDRLLRMFSPLAGQKVAIGNNLAEIADSIRRNLGRQRMVVLASGDPNFYGIARALTRELGKEAVEIIPNVSAMQLAFARIKESWDDAVLTSVHSRPIEDIVDVVRSHRKVGILTDDEHSPGEIARALQEHGVENCRAYVCQDLGTASESVVATDLYSLREKEFSALNVLILVREPGEAQAQQLLGIPDEKFNRWREGLITKLEVRAVSLAKMGLTRDSIVWDIGAGSGAVAIEASLLAERGTIFAIEQSARAVATIKENIQRFSRPNIRVIQTSAPERLEGLPDPDVVFIGGSGGRMAEILSVAGARLRPGGRIVVNVVTLETLHAAASALRGNGFTVEMTLVNAARSRDISELTRLEALNPVFILAARRHTEGGGAE